MIHAIRQEKYLYSVAHIYVCHNSIFQQEICLIKIKPYFFKIAVILTVTLLFILGKHTEQLC